MGYEIKIFVVKEYSYNTGDRNGETIAMLDLCKCGGGEFATLNGRSIQEQKSAERKFHLYAMNPDRQREGVELIRQTFPGDKEKKELSDHLEDGTVARDKYGDPLGVIPLDEAIAALQKDYADSKYRRFGVAVALLQSIKQHFPNDKILVVTYGH